MKTHAERLAEWRQTYTDRRTVPWQMLEAAERVLEWGLRDAERGANIAVARAEGKLEEAHAETERVRESLTKQIETLREHRDMLQRQIDKKRTIAETRSQEGEQVRVQIGREGWNGWQIADIEEIAYRLRCGGAVDETPLKINDREASALVPAPDLVKLESPRHVTPAEKVAKILTAEQPTKRKPMSWTTRMLILGSASGAIGALLTAIVSRLA